MIKNVAMINAFSSKVVEAGARLDGFYMLHKRPHRGQPHQSIAWKTLELNAGGFLEPDSADGDQLQEALMLCSLHLSVKSLR